MKESYFLIFINYFIFLNVHYILILWGNLNMSLKILLFDNRMRLYEILRDLCYSAFTNYLLPAAMSGTRLGTGDIVQKVPQQCHRKVRRSKQGLTILDHAGKASGEHTCLQELAGGHLTQS